MKKFLKFAGITLLLLVGLAFILPYVFKSKIILMVKSEINKNVDAKVEFKDLNLSLFRHFPKLTVVLEDISVAGINEFEKDTLLSARELEASVNIMSMFSADDMTIYGVFLESPRIHALVTKEGKANWDIAKPDTATATTVKGPSPFSMSLQKYAIKNGYVLYEDKSTSMSAEITDLNHEGSGDFTDELFTLTTSSKAATASFTYANIPYLINAKTGINADFEVNNKTSTYTFKNADLEVNALKLIANGFFQLVNDSTYKMDISFDAPSNEFKDILSLVPAIYKNDFNRIKTSGNASFKGFVKGFYSPYEMPAYKVDLEIKDGFFQYPDLPQPVKNIQILAQISNPDGKADNTIIDVTKGHLEMGGEPFDFRLLFKNPETVRYIDANVKGRLNLSEITKVVKLDPATKLGGMMSADAFVRGNLSAIEQQNGPFTAGGFIEINKFHYASKELPQPIQNGNFTIQLENNGGTPDGTLINITSGHIEIAKDPIDFSLTVRNPVSDIDFTGAAKGKFTLANVKQFVTLEPGTSLSGLLDADLSFSGSKAAIDRKEYSSINTAGLVNLSNITYISKDYPDGVKIRSAQLRFDSKKAAFNNLNGSFKGSQFIADGVFNNLIGYALQEEQLQGTVNLEVDRMNLNDWMGTDTTTTTTATTTSDPFLVPANMDIAVNVKAGAVQYDDVRYNNVRGTLQLRDETVQLQNVQTEALGGAITFNGLYATRDNKKQPDIRLSYDIKEVDIQKAFFAFNTVQKLMPVGKFLAGKLSSQMSMNGRLNGDMMPDLTTLTGNGSLLVIQGVLGKFEPLQKLATVLNVDALKEINLKDIKSHFEFANGKVLVKPFSIKVKDIDMQIGGMHGFNQTMDYIIAMKVPRKYIGASGNALVNNLAMQANNKGIPVNISEVIDLNIKMGGSISNPVIKTDLKQAGGDAMKDLKQQASSFAQQKIDSTKQMVKDSLKVVKNQVVTDVKKEIGKQLFGTKDSTTKTKSLDSAKKKTTETIKNLGNFFKKKKSD